MPLPFILCDSHLCSTKKLQNIKSTRFSRSCAFWLIDNVGNWIDTVIKKLFALVLGFLTKFFRLHIRGLFEYIGKMRLIEESAFLRYKRYRFVR